MSMNLFRLAGDMTHVLSILVLLLRLQAAKNANGISLKTQELYLVVFVTRYLDLFTTYISLYNTLMKILYISATSYIIFMVTNMDKVIPDRKSFDTFKTHYVYLVCAVLGLITNIIQGFDIIDLFWIFSIYLESVAILPQLMMLITTHEVENLTSQYIFLLGLYRALYILNWVYRSYHETYYKHNWVVYSCGILQTCLYLDFFYYFFISRTPEGKMVMPR